MKKVNTTVIILLVIIFILVAILGYGVYTGVRVKSAINSLQSQINQLTEERDELQRKYSLLQDDVFQLEKSCLTENVCKNQFPWIRYNCNDLGEAHSDGTKICRCDNNCQVIIN